MKNWIARLFGAGAAPDPAPTGTPASGAPAATPAAARAADAPADLDTAFWRWLSAGIAGAAPEALRQRLLDELDDLAARPDDAAALVPRVPEVIPTLLRSLRDESVDAAGLARQVARDPLLVLETIREANSPFHRPAAPVRTVEAAVLVLGQNGLRMLLARVAFRPVIGMAGGACARQAAPRLWRHAQCCARAGALLAGAHGADPFEAYLAGLVRDLGLVAALRLADQVLEAPALPQDAAFAAALLAHARELSARIVLAWKLPPPIGAAILRAGPGASQPLAALLDQAARLATLRLLLDDGALDADDPLLDFADARAARAFERIGGADEP